MQDGCNRSVWGGSRGNVFVESQHSDMRDHAIDLDSVSEIAVTLIIPFSASSKTRTACQVETSCITSSCGQHETEISRRTARDRDFPVRGTGQRSRAHSTGQRLPDIVSGRQSPLAIRQHIHFGSRSGYFIAQGTATDTRGGQESRGLSIDGGISIGHGIVKACATRFNKIRNTTAKNQIQVFRGLPVRRAHKPASAPVRTIHDRLRAVPGRDPPPDCRRCFVGCQMQFAPLRAQRCVRIGGTEALGIQE
jgi:hypothetical protein